jgi:hypothetical protein
MQITGTNFLKKLYNNEFSLFSDIAYKRSTEKKNIPLLKTIFTQFG